jgi:stalled ribosome alternative rescue factor ArfA
MRKKLKSKKVRAIILFNTSTRQHKQSKGTGSFSRKKKFAKDVDYLD